MDLSDLNPLDSLFDLGKSAIERIWPDPVKQAEEMRKLEALRQDGDLAKLNAHVKLMIAQLEVNKAEAQHKSIFVAGWRPFIGWVGGVALAYQFVLYPLLIWIWAVLQINGYVPSDLDAPPILDTSALMAVVTGMLGIGMMRSYDKKHKTQTDKI